MEGSQDDNQVQNADQKVQQISQDDYQKQFQQDLAVTWKEKIQEITDENNKTLEETKQYASDNDAKNQQILDAKTNLDQQLLQQRSSMEKSEKTLKDLKAKLQSINQRVAVFKKEQALNLNQIKQSSKLFTKNQGDLISTLSVFTDEQLFKGQAELKKSFDKAVNDAKQKLKVQAFEQNFKELDAKIKLAQDRQLVLKDYLETLTQKLQATYGFKGFSAQFKNFKVQVRQDMLDFQDQTRKIQFDYQNQLDLFQVTILETQTKIAQLKNHTNSAITEKTQLDSELVQLRREVAYDQQRYQNLSEEIQQNEQKEKEQLVNLDELEKFKINIIQKSQDLVRQENLMKNIGNLTNQVSGGFDFDTFENALKSQIDDKLAELTQLDIQMLEIERSIENKQQFYSNVITLKEQEIVAQTTNLAITRLEEERLIKAQETERLKFKKMCRIRSR
eukprot:403346413